MTYLQTRLTPEVIIVQLQAFVVQINSSPNYQTWHGDLGTLSKLSLTCLFFWPFIVRIWDPRLQRTCILKSRLVHTTVYVTQTDRRVCTIVYACAQYKIIIVTDAAAVEYTAMHMYKQVKQ